MNLLHFTVRAIKNATVNNCAWVHIYWLWLCRCFMTILNCDHFYRMNETRLWQQMFGWIWWVLRICFQFERFIYFRCLKMFFEYFFNPIMPWDQSINILKWFKISNSSKYMSFSKTNVECCPKTKIPLKILTLTLQSLNTKSNPYSTS